MTHKAVLLVLGAVGLASTCLLTSACLETRRSVGEDCLKSQDCLSGICSQLVCVAAPSTTDQKPQGEGGGAAEAGSDVGTPAEAAAESGADAGGDAPSDATGQ
jgi:hypothetical protein